MEKIHPETGEILHRDIRPIEYTYKGEKIVVNQPGWYPDEGDDGILTSEDWKISDEVLKILKMRHAEKKILSQFLTNGKKATATG